MQRKGIRCGGGGVLEGSGDSNSSRLKIVSEGRAAREGSAWRLSLLSPCFSHFLFHPHGLGVAPPSSSPEGVKSKHSEGSGELGPHPLRPPPCLGSWRERRKRLESAPNFSNAQIQPPLRVPCFCRDPGVPVTVTVWIWGSAAPPLFLSSRESCLPLGLITASVSGAGGRGEAGRGGGGRPGPQRGQAGCLWEQSQDRASGARPSPTLKGFWPPDLRGPQFGWGQLAVHCPVPGGHPCAASAQARVVSTRPACPVEGLPGLGDPVLSPGARGGAGVGQARGAHCGGAGEGPHCGGPCQPGRRLQQNRVRPNVG